MVLVDWDRDKRPLRPLDEGGPGSAIGQVLLRRGVVSARKLAETERQAHRQDARLADTLRLHLAIPARTIAEAEAEAMSAGVIDPVAAPPDRRLLRQIDSGVLLRHGVLPWRRIAGETIVLTHWPDRFERVADMLTAVYGPVRMAITTEDDLQLALRHATDNKLTERAEALVCPNESCRGWNLSVARHYGLAILALALTGLIVAPRLVFGVLCGWAILTLITHMALKAATLFFALRPGNDPGATGQAGDAEVLPLRLPVVTLFVPLFHEDEIAGHLVRRLSAIDYPKELLDVCLLLEADDLITQTALRDTNLPRWMRAIIVPRGTLKTKPRALNFGLAFARGSIIGVYDAEDRPAPDQIRQVVARFAAAPADVACLQGILDFYNDRTNWLSRCFTVEYATWFRIVLPGLTRLGLVVPLGGTTLFFRRQVIDELGGWDAHNVTEDADLGIRLARHGYRTEMIQSVTEEEANCRAWPWVKQRSRWLKGYAITYAVHMRNPRRLWAELGARRFWGVQVQFLGTLSQFALAPVLWSFWLLPLGFQHPLSDVLPGWAFVALGSLFLLAEVLNITTAAVAVTRARKPWLIKWALTLHLYFPLAAIASYKGIWELFWRPFYWDKTAHGIYLSKD